MLGDYEDAGMWLEYVDRVDGKIPLEFVARSRALRERLESQARN
jgi:hypothetical protein